METLNISEKGSKPLKALPVLGRLIYKVLVIAWKTSSKGEAIVEVDEIGRANGGGRHIMANCCNPVHFPGVLGGHCAPADFGLLVLASLYQKAEEFTLPCPADLAKEPTGVSSLALWVEEF